MAVKFTRDTLRAPTKTQGDFNLAHRFTVEIDGVSIGGVHSVEGLQHEHEVVEYNDGDDITTRFRPGRKKPGKVKITRDFAANREFFNWRKTVLDGKVDRKSVSIILLSDSGEEAMRYNLYECWPTTYIGPSLNARNSAHASEAIEIAFETMDMK
jgi:phage tail-like protein